MSLRSMRLLLTGLVLAACSTEGPVAPLSEAGGAAPITTDSTHYTLRPQGGGYAVNIAIRFQNQSNSRMYIVNCHQQLAPILQKRVGDEWVNQWMPVLLMCLSPPMVLASGEVLERTLPVWGAMPNTNMGPQWATADLEGTYRIVLNSLVYNYDDRRQQFGDVVPLHLRVSNEFTLSR